MLYRSKIAVTLLIVLVSIFPAGVFATPVAQQGNFKVSVSGTAPGSIPHDIALKVTQIPGGQLSEATGFAIKPESVVQVKQGENIMVTTNENLKVSNVKARNIQGQQVDLLPLPNNLWSLQNLVPGVYLLDVIVDMSSSGILGVYETVLVILQPDQSPLPPTTVINQVRILIETEFIFEDGSQPDDNQTDLIDDNQTDLIDDNQTDPIICTMEISYGQGPCDEYYIPPGEDGQCPEGHRFIDDNTGCVPDNEFGPPPPCPLNAVGIVCPPTDEPTPEPCPIDAAGNEVCPPTDEPTPMPKPPPPECPDAGPEVCGEEPPPEEGSPDDGTPPDDGDVGDDEDDDEGADTTDEGADTTNEGADTTDEGADTTNEGADTTDEGEGDEGDDDSQFG